MPDLTPLFTSRTAFVVGCLVALIVVAFVLSGLSTLVSWFRETLWYQSDSVRRTHFKRYRSYGILGVAFLAGLLIAVIGLTARLDFVEGHGNLVKYDGVTVTGGAWNSDTINVTGYSEITVYTKTIAPAQTNTVVFLYAVQASGSETEIARIDTPSDAYREQTFSVRSPSVRVRISGPVLPLPTATNTAATSAEMTAFPAQTASPSPTSMMQSISPAARVDLFLFLR